MGVRPPAPHAACVSGNEATHSLIVEGTVYVVEDPVNGTCNGNDYYQSNFRSLFPGWRASVHIQNNGLWTGHYGGYDTNTYFLSYEDNNSNSRVISAWTTSASGTAAGAATTTTPSASTTRTAV
ncbi:hypothetical protein AB0H83_19240 [Dactylosporangium sp. NPDC050688]|uniref:hypothetical protein n=1 Tax=Dactylosporangium sp. NPDC050688 TaxID=3157217 RepID=UPI0033E14A97